MKTKLPKLSAALVVLFLPLLLLLGPAVSAPQRDRDSDATTAPRPNSAAPTSAGQGGTAPQSPATNPPDEGASLPEAPSGNELLKKSRQMLLKQTSIAAGIRQQVDIYGQKFLGAGSYRQYGKGPRKLLRLELKMQLGEDSVSLLQVRDQRFLWIQKTLLNETRLSRVDLERLRKDLADGAGGPTPDTAAAATSSLALGGLPAILDGLLAHFDFEPARAEEIGGEPVWILQGSWKREALIQLMDKSKVPENPRDIPLEALPLQLPNRIQVVWRDRLLPYFPFRIDFQRQPLEEGTTDQVAEPQNLLSLEFFEVHLGSPLDHRQFRFYAGEEELIDDTAKYAARLRERGSPR